MKKSSNSSSTASAPSFAKAENITSGSGIREGPRHFARDLFLAPIGVLGAQRMTEFFEGIADLRRLVCVSQRRKPAHGKQLRRSDIFIENPLAGVPSAPQGRHCSWTVGMVADAAQGHAAPPGLDRGAGFL